MIFITIYITINVYLYFIVKLNRDILHICRPCKIIIHWKIEQEIALFPKLERYKYIVLIKTCRYCWVLVL